MGDAASTVHERKVSDKATATNEVTVFVANLPKPALPPATPVNGGLKVHLDRAELRIAWAEERMREQGEFIERLAAGGYDTSHAREMVERFQETLASMRGCHQMLEKLTESSE
jgi:hypothetical protein